ncbi:MAG: peptidase U32 family protein [Oscillospiraceae bacterium]
MESLLAAVRCGCDAVYLGGKRLNARQGAQNFDEAQLSEAVSHCHARDVAVHMAINTIVYDRELKEAEAAIRQAAAAGVDALIIQDLAVARIARECAPGIALHASTQMAVHNLEGVGVLAELGFSRVVLARELSLGEIAHICGHSPIEVECFVHGALCMSVSGQCYLSAALGGREEKGERGRSGNRGSCAQPCRLPFCSKNSESALSLKDMSYIEQLPQLEALGVASVKIEGRLKRPEYVAAAVTACVEARDGQPPDMEPLRAVFSRSGFTDGYLDGKLGDGMFGTRRKEDVAAAGPVLRDLEKLYKEEKPRVPVDFALTVASGQPVRLIVRDDAGNEVACEGAPPQDALTAPLSEERASSLLSKTGGTPFSVRNVTTKIGDGLMVPASALNALRRDCLSELLALREAPKSKPFTPFDWSRAGGKTGQSSETGTLPELSAESGETFRFQPPRGQADCLDKQAGRASETGIMPELSGAKGETFRFQPPRGQAGCLDKQAGRASETGIMPELSGAKGETFRFQPPRGQAGYPDKRAGRASETGIMPVRVRLSSPEQLTDGLAAAADWLILPLNSAGDISARFREKTILELPRIVFSPRVMAEIREQLQKAGTLGYRHLLGGNLSAVALAKEESFLLHGDFPLNAVNALAAGELEKLGFADITIGLEGSLSSKMPLQSGLLVYGHLPLMVFRNHPAGMQGADGFLIDRKRIKFPVRREVESSVLYNGTPLWLGDRQGKLGSFAFTTLWFSDESPGQCVEILRLYREEKAFPGPFTRGLYSR